MDGADGDPINSNNADGADNPNCAIGCIVADDCDSIEAAGNNDEYRLPEYPDAIDPASDDDDVDADPVACMRDSDSASFAAANAASCSRCSCVAASCCCAADVVNTFVAAAATAVVALPLALGDSDGDGDDMYTAVGSSIDTIGTNDVVASDGDNMDATTSPADGATCRAAWTGATTIELTTRPMDDEECEDVDATSGPVDDCDLVFAPFCTRPACPLVVNAERGDPTGDDLSDDDADAERVVGRDVADMLLF